MNILFSLTTEVVNFHTHTHVYTYTTLQSIGVYAAGRGRLRISCTNIVIINIPRENGPRGANNVRFIVVRLPVGEIPGNRKL